MACIYNGLSFSHKKEIMPFVTTWIKLEGIILRLVRERQILCGITYMCNLKKCQTHRNRRIEWRLSGAGGWRE